MLNRIHARFASLALLVAAAAFVFSACDSGGSGASLPTTADSTFQIGKFEIAGTSKSALGVDLSTTDTTFSVEFTETVAQNEYTTLESSDQVSEDGQNDELNLSDQVRLQVIKAKDATVSNTIPVELSWADSRSDLRISLADDVELTDGYWYRLDLGSPDPDGVNGTGVFDRRFQSSEDGQLVSNPDLPASNLRFAVGVDNSAPSTPDVSINNSDGDNNYTDLTTTFEVVLDGNSVPDVKGYEVFYNSQDTDGFVKADNVSPSASSSEYADSEGIVEAEELTDADTFVDEGDAGEIEFTATTSPSDFGTPDAPTQSGEYPFAADDGGSYGPIEVKVRAVSHNGVRSDFTSATTIQDNEAPLATSANIEVSNTQATDSTLVVEFDEPLNKSTVETSDFALSDDGDDTGTLNGTPTIENIRAEDANTGATVRINVDDDDTDIQGDVLTITGVEDFRGNDNVEGDDDDIVGQIPDNQFRLNP